MPKPGSPEFTEDDCYPLVDIIWRWIDIRQANGYESFPTRADFRKSRLLLRLLQGKEPLPLPPPLFASGPAYELIEEGRANNVLVTFYPHGALGSVRSGANIWGSLWQLGEQQPDGSWPVSHTRAPGNWVLRRSTVTTAALKGYFAVGQSFSDSHPDEVVTAVEPGPNEGTDYITRTCWDLVRVENLLTAEPGTA